MWSKKVFPVVKCCGGCFLWMVLSLVDFIFFVERHQAGWSHSLSSPTTSPQNVTLSTRCTSSIKAVKVPLNFFLVNFSEDKNNFALLHQNFFMDKCIGSQEITFIIKNYSSSSRFKSMTGKKYTIIYNLHF